MPIAYAGPAPWEQFKAVRGGEGNRSSFSQGSMEWDLSTGWHFERAEGWKKLTKPKSKTVVGLDGKKHKLYSYSEFDDYIGFSSHASNEQERLAYAEEAFKDNGNVFESDGVGHIEHIAYAKPEQILKVTFKNGDECLFFRVPNSVAGQLIHHAQSGNIAYTDDRGIKRHKLGVEFWNLVRIRGQHVGARYPFEYKKQSNGMYVSHSRDRYTLSIEPGLIKQIFGDKFNDRLNLKKDNEKISLVLSEQEFAKLLEELDYFNRMTGADLDKESGNIPKAFVVDKNGKKRRMTLDDLDKYQTQDNGTLREVKTTDQISREGNRDITEDDIEGHLLTKLTDITQKTASSKVQDFIERINVDKKLFDGGRIKSFTEILKDKGINAQDLKRLMSIRKANALDEDPSRSIKSIRDLMEMLNAIAPGTWKSWVKDTLPELRKVSYSGKVWTPKELEEFANASVDGNISLGHAGTYKKLIKNKDYTGALNFLKTHKKAHVLKDKFGQKKTVYKNYASNYDQLGTED